MSCLLARKPLAVWQDETPDPVCVFLLRANAIVLETYLAADPIEQPGLG